MCSQYYDDTFQTAKEQKVFEKNLFGKTHRENGEIIMLDGFTIVYRSSVDLFFYVMGSANENGVRHIFLPSECPAKLSSILLAVDSG